MATDRTINVLLRQGLLSQGDVDAVSDAIIATPSSRLVPVGAAHTLNLTRFLRTHAFVGKTLRDPDASLTLKKAALNKVILMAQLEVR
ncbi:hypothetical protein [Methylobacterium oxalidis]|uniref:Uncharacterized protein n=1 Tax=Methylobacterium oxalidis TaxID=944322 RepID=A0A512J3E8_9HYPH|nr:hypothetical protein [Methylobacterium oxalidis]GEP04460.1 hypothetical protein MOX02_24980 [Methylobacterium oxalidis]GJE32093.1 hypothetical protein LDDCCGHA_2275 [Methylobacterium oxalidis]GLS62832.1 hypothetical protein GCM10007888_12130 [Methylobacterium oxalidis]